MAREKVLEVKAHESSSWRERVKAHVRVRHRLRSGAVLLRGAWVQILQTALAACGAWFLSVLLLGVEEAAISALIIMITFHSPESGLPLERFLEALIGGGTALLINALLPINPERMVEEAAHPLFEESVEVLGEVAGALEEGDAERAQSAYVKAREIDARVGGLKEAVAAGRETARLAPPRRGSIGHLELYARAQDQIDLTVRDVRAIARAALSVVQPGDPSPEALPSSVRGLGGRPRPWPPTWKRPEIQRTRDGSHWRLRGRPACSCRSAKTSRGASPSTR